MVPERRWKLPVRVLVHGLLPGREGRLGIAVELRLDVGAVQVDDRARVGVLGCSVGAQIDVQVVARAEQAGRRVPQVVFPRHRDGLAHRGLDGRARIGGAGAVVVAPHRGRPDQLGVELLLRLAHADVIRSCAARRPRHGLRDRGERKGVDEGRQYYGTLDARAGSPLHRAALCRAARLGHLDALSLSIRQAAAGGARVRGADGPVPLIDTRAGATLDDSAASASAGVAAGASDDLGREVDGELRALLDRIVLPAAIPLGSARAAVRGVLEKPAVVAGRGIEPALNVGRHLGRAPGGRGPDARNGRLGAQRGREVTSQGRPLGRAGLVVGIVVRIAPGHVAELRGVPATLLAAGVRRPLAPGGQDAPQVDGAVARDLRAVDVELQGDAVDRGSRRYVARDVELEQRAALVAAIGISGEDIGAGTVRLLLVLRDERGILDGADDDHVRCGGCAEQPDR